MNYKKLKDMICNYVMNMAFLISIHYQIFYTKNVTIACHNSKASTKWFSSQINLAPAFRLFVLVNLDAILDVHKHTQYSS